MATIQACELVKIVRNGTPYLYGVIGGTGGTMAALVGKTKPDQPMRLWLVTALSETEFELAFKAANPQPKQEGPDLTPPHPLETMPNNFPPSEDNREAVEDYRGEF